MVYWYTIEKVKGLYKVEEHKQEDGFLLIKHQHVGEAKTLKEAEALRLKFLGVKQN